MEEAESKLAAFRARKRRQAAIDGTVNWLRNMIPLFHTTTSADPSPVPLPVPVEARPKKEKKPTIAPPDDSTEDEVLPFSDSDDDVPTAAARQAKSDAPEKTSDRLTYVIWLAYALFWCTCWAIAIELQFGTVYLLLSAIAGIYLNTRTGPRRRKEVSAYSVFNPDCRAIDGTLNAEQFDREIRYGPANVR